MSSSQELLNQITASVEELAQATEATRQDALFQRYLDTCARFHQYSTNNIMLILLHDSEATQVAGFNTWKSLGRYVRKGEKGIPILAPIFRKHKEPGKEDETMLVGFRTVYVFDVTQTEGEPLGEMPEWRSLARDEDLTIALHQYAAQQGILVEIKDFPDDTQGCSSGGKIRLSPDAGTKTFIHELAHEAMHFREGSHYAPLPGALKECEAEGVGYVVARYFDLPDLKCPTYLALHGLDAQHIMEHLERIRAVSAEMIDALTLLFSPCHGEAVQRQVEEVQHA